MSNPGETDLLVQSRSALLDALTALDRHKDSVIVIGAQAVYLRCGKAPVALAESTKDSDLVVDPRQLGNEPLLEEAMSSAGFYMNVNGNPGAWLNRHGIPVDLMIPELLSGRTSKNARSARMPPHSKTALRVARGLEACVIDRSTMAIKALDAADTREFTVLVAGSAALIVAKIHKLNERIDAPNRLNDKDAHDLYRLLIASETTSVAKNFARLLAEPVSARATKEALVALKTLFGDGPEATGSMMAGRAEAGIGDPQMVAASSAALADELLKEISKL
ncbi:hypothetical protein [Rhodococcoides yunnanense]|uniref:hypothetical protein n=1 Tax=Rhodococcoides yunnanense TaxID=278209 RepID=UPI0009353B4E|nr:hypothetical protein [Rhodococcus yunnanensis]